MHRTLRRHGATLVLLVLSLSYATLGISRVLTAQDRNITAEVNAAAGADTDHGAFEYFSFMRTDKYSHFEKTMLWIVLGTAVAALVYSFLLVGQVMRADTGTPKMKVVADATRQGANAYLGATVQAHHAADRAHHGGSLLHDG